MQLRTAGTSLILGLIMATASIAQAHHSVTGVFDGDEPLELTGTITEVEWINPHVFLHLEVANEDGSVTSWQLETVPTSMFRNGGITKAMLEGDGAPVTITAIRTHDKSLDMGWIHRITYADGRFYDISNSGR